MPIEFIPNQAALFENPIGTQPCLNNDPKAYAQLAQPGDTLCVQWKMLPCVEDISCEPDMVQDPLGGDQLFAWNTSNGWSSSASDNASYDGSGGAGVCDQTINGLTVGAVYKYTLEVTNATGAVSLEVAFGLDVRGPITEPGVYTYYFVCVNSTTTVTLLMDSLAVNPGDLMDIINMSIVQQTTCWLDGLSSGVASWSYSYDNGVGKFCSLNFNGGDLTNNAAYTTAGNYHRVTFTVSGWSQGSVSVTIGGTLIGTVSGEGEFQLYGVPANGSGDLVFGKVDLFDGCISNVSVDDYYVLADRYNVWLSDTTNTIATGTFEPTFYEDRAIFCKTWNELDPTVTGDCDYFKVTIQETCDDETYDIYHSVNLFSYNLNGWDCSKVMEAWSDGFAYGFYFGDVDNPDFKLRQRLRVLQFAPKYPNNGEEYLYSNGSTQRSYAEASKRRICWFDYIDENAHDTVRIQLLCQKLFIDNYAFYFPTADYEPEWAENGKYNLAQSRIELEHEQTLFGVTCGTQSANAICPPEIVFANYSKVQLYGIMDLTGMTLTALYYNTFSVTVAGGYTIAGAGGPFNVTLLAGRAALLTAIQAWFDPLFSVTSTGTCTLAGNVLTINIEGNLDQPVPQPSGAILLTDNTVSVGLSTIHS
jgi:hypothetical protein